MKDISLSARLRLALLTLLLVSAAACSGNNGYNAPPTTPGNTLELDSGDLGNGASYQHVFNTAGTFPYHCIHHSPMVGSVVVSASATDTLVNISIVSATSPFPAASVKPGGRVIWTNNTAMLHTVTSN